MIIIKRIILRVSQLAIMLNRNCIALALVVVVVAVVRKQKEIKIKRKETTRNTTQSI